MLTIRPETVQDIAAIRQVNEQAFSGTAEADLVDKLRQRGVPLISLVADDKNKVVGHILFSPVTIAGQNPSLNAVGMGPLAVLPAYQRKGIGSQLMRAGLEACRQAKCEVVIVLGHPHYYPRFGFVPAKNHNIRCEFDVPEEAFMLLELRQGILTHGGGTVHYQPEFKGV